jgi:hypothetical protein
VKGASTFQQTFPQRGPRDPQGRSLRDFDLETRIFRYPLSYMSYSDVFDNLPVAVRDRVYKRLIEVLTAKEPEPKFARLNAETRRAILQIVAATKPAAPQAWRDAAATF